jgi:hypothetical protein
MSSCHAGAGERQLSYHLGSPQVMERGSLVLAVAVQDHRPYVLNGDMRSTFVGLSRAGFRIPYKITTVSGQSLSADFATSIRRGLEKAGYRVKTVDIFDRASPGQVRIELLQTGAQRGLAVRIQEWKSDTYKYAALDYAVALEVFDAVGQEIGRTAIKGREVLGGDVLDPAALVEKAAPVAYTRKLEELLNAPAIRRALGPPTAAPLEPPTAPLPPSAPAVTPPRPSPAVE